MPRFRFDLSDPLKVGSISLRGEEGHWCRTTEIGVLGLKKYSSIYGQCISLWKFMYFLKHAKCHFLRTSIEYWGLNRN